MLQGVRIREQGTQDVRIEAKERSPEITFDFEANLFSVKGESYPEDVTEFYGPIVGELESHLGGLSDATVTFEFELIYFNSSTAKVLMGLFDLLDETANNGNDVTITWIYEEDDENMMEMGEEFGEDLLHANFQLKKIPVE